MSRRRLFLVATSAVLLAALAFSAPALAAAGGGSAGFGGGGGGGGGGGFHGGGGGRGAGLYILFQILIRIAIFGHGLGALMILGLILIYVLATRVTPWARRSWEARQQSGRAARRRVAHRSRHVELAAAEAAEDDPAFAPDQVRPAAAKLFTEIQAAWSNADTRRLQELVGPRLRKEWERRLDDFEHRGWRNRVELLDEPKVEYVGLSRTEDDGGRVVVRVEATLRDYVSDASGNHIKRSGRLSETVKIREFWTLQRHGDGWVLLSIEQGAEGSHALDQQIVATPWSDEQGLRDEALLEGAVADAVPKGTSIAELADLDFDGEARAAALDMSLVDGRFAPDVLEVSARRAVAAWADAIDGDETPLRALATPTVVDELLHPGDPSRKTRVVVRGPKVEQIRIAAFNAAATPPTMTVDVSIEGKRYIEDRATTQVVAGSPSRANRFLEHWTFALQDDGGQPWRIVSADAQVHAV